MRNEYLGEYTAMRQTYTSFYLFYFLKKTISLTNKRIIIEKPGAPSIFSKTKNNIEFTLKSIKSVGVGRKLNIPLLILGLASGIIGQLLYSWGSILVIPIFGFILSILAIFILIGSLETVIIIKSSIAPEAIIFNVLPFERRKVFELVKEIKEMTSRANTAS
jgi:hypothetical protein